MNIAIMMGIEGSGHHIWWNLNENLKIGGGNGYQTYQYTYPNNVIHTLESYPYNHSDRVNTIKDISVNFGKWYQNNCVEDIKIVVQFRNLIDCYYSFKKRFGFIRENHKQIMLLALNEINKQVLFLCDKYNAEYKILNYDSLVRCSNFDSLINYSGVPKWYFSKLKIKKPAQYKDIENVKSFFERHFDMQDFYFDSKRQLI